MCSTKSLRKVVYLSMALITLSWIANRAIGSHLIPVASAEVPLADQDVQEVGDQAFFELAALKARREAAGRPYLPFLDVPTLRMGLYVLAAGATDGQRPHTLDETYYIVKGKGMFKAGDKDTPVQEGSVLFVKAEVDHQFYDITEDLEILVFFSTATPGK